MDTGKRLLELNGELADNTDRFHAVSDHLKNVRQELQNAQVKHQNTLRTN